MKIPRWAKPVKLPKWTLPVVAPVVAVLTATGLFLSACGQDDPRGRLDTAAGAKPSKAPVRQASPSAAPVPTTLEVANVSRLGRVVTDQEGRTLYRFDDDKAKPPTSTCVDACAKAWPPVPAGNGAVPVKGVDEDLVGKVRRPDGTWQVTLAGWPLYTFAEDERPGQAKGQGVAGSWYAARADGEKVAPPRPEREAGGRWAGWTVVKVREDPRYGMIVTDGKGRVMYRFDKDRKRVTNCFGDCKKAWPPVRFTNWKKLKVQGVDRKLVDFIERKDDGTCQLTINGWPMYYYAKDQEPGETNGQGVQKVWWLSSPRGGRITTPAGGDAGYAY